MERPRAGCTGQSGFRTTAACTTAVCEQRCAQGSCLAPMAEDGDYLASASIERTFRGRWYLQV